MPKKKPKALPVRRDDWCDEFTGHKPNKDKTHCLCGKFKIGETAKDLGHSTSGFERPKGNK